MTVNIVDKKSKSDPTIQVIFLMVMIYNTIMNNHVHSAPQEHIERERKDSEHRKNTQNIHNITTIHKPHGLEK